MSELIDELQKEYVELDAKLLKLDEFICEHNSMKYFEYKQYWLLLRQRAGLLEYLDALLLRLTDLKEIEERISE